LGGRESFSETCMTDFDDEFPAPKTLDDLDRTLDGIKDAIASIDARFERIEEELLGEPPRRLQDETSHLFFRLRWLASDLSWVAVWTFWQLIVLGLILWRVW
jgi:hypothetical protein